MAYDLAKVTDAGNNLVASILANKSSLSIDKIEVSDTKLPSTTDITKLTSISDVVQTIQANGFLKNENTLIVSSVLDNSKISKDYKAWVFGIWGSDSQNGQSKLMAVITATNAPDTIPAYSGSTPVSYRYNFNIGFSNAGNVQFNMINGSFATNDTVVHTTGDETINGQKKFDTDPTDGAGNAYAKTVDVNQQLDKKVNIADMRKPASDVVGLEDVPQAVVHSALASGVDLDTVLTPGVYPFVVASFTSYIDKGTYWGYLVVTSEGNIVTQTAYTTGTGQPLYRMWSGSPASWGPWVKMANDYAVAHLSGANNFDTVPTVKNNPLLLTSNLPSDIARTGSNQEFTGKNTFDTAPIDKTTGHPYITKDGVPAIPSTLADTTKDANFTGKLQKSGIDVATKTDVSSAVNTATSNFSKHIEASKNNEDSAISDSTKGNSNDIYYWTEG